MKTTTSVGIKYKNNKLSRITIDEIFEEVCEIFRQSPEMVKSKSRKRRYLFCRYIVAYVSYLLARATFEVIGSYLGARDHSSILSGNAKVRDWIKYNDPDFKMVWETYIEKSEIWKQYATK